MKTIKKLLQNIKSHYIIIMILSIIIIGPIVIIIKILQKENAANEKYKGKLITFWLILSVIVAVIPFLSPLLIVWAYSQGA